MDPITQALIAALADALVKVLIRFGADVAYPAVRRKVVELIDAGYSISDIPKLVFSTFGVNSVEEAEVALGEEVAIVACPMSPGDEAVVSYERGEYDCPFCRSSIFSNGNEVWHKELLGYTCPDTREKAWIPAEPGEYICRPCKLGAEVKEEGGYHLVYHQLRLK